MENLRSELYKKMEEYGLDYEKIIDADRKLHNKIIEFQRKELDKYKKQLVS